MRQPIIFLSYSHLEKRNKDRLVTQINVLQLAGKVELWSDDRIEAGGDWKKQIDQAMARASVAVLLISAKYLNSVFILDVEVPKLLERHRKDGLRVIPVIARPCAWQEVPWLAAMNVLPKDGKPVWRSGGRYVDTELANIATEISALFKQSDLSATAKPGAVSTMMMGSVRDQVQEATEAIDAEITKVQVTGEQITLAAISRIIRVAINYGVPIYNQGAIKGCAQIYCHTAKKLVSLIEQSGYGHAVAVMKSMTGSSVMKGTKTVRSTTLGRDAGVEIAYSELKPASRFNVLTEQNVDKVAWSIRHRFDQLSYVANSLKSIEGLMPPADKFLEDIAITKVLEVAIDQANFIYEAGQRRNRRWIAGCATVYLYTAQKLLPVLPIHSSNKRDQEIAKTLEAKLGQLLFAGLFITPENAYEVAWGIRHAFDQALSVSHKD